MTLHAVIFEADADAADALFSQIERAGRIVSRARGKNGDRLAIIKNGVLVEWVT